VEVGSMPASSIPKVNGKPNEYFDIFGPKLMSILPTDDNEIARIFNTLKPNASPGKDSCHPKLFVILVNI
jgi:hypothetical protein